MSLNSAKMTGKKRKQGTQPATPGMPNCALPTPSQSHMSAAPEPIRPPSPKRPRFKVEYRPLHVPTMGLGGWDERRIASTFPKHNRQQHNRSIHELNIVDMDAVLMCLRSRLPKELGYAITVLSMLSLAYPEDNYGGLPVSGVPEIMEELLELLAEKALGDEGLDGFKGSLHQQSSASVNKVLFSELQRLGKDKDNSFEASEYRRSPEIVLALLNLLRNLSLFPLNHEHLAVNTDLLQLLVAVSDPALCTAFGGSVYTVVELARAQRDVVSIFANMGDFVDLRQFDFATVTSLFRLLSSFLVPAWEVIQAASHTSMIYGPPVQERPPVVLSICRALEAFSKLAAADTNREVFSRLPASDVVGLYAALIKLLPVDNAQIHVVSVNEDILCFAEMTGLALYSLAFLATPATRAEMRRVPGAVDIVSRIILKAAPIRQQPPSQAPGAPPVPFPSPIANLSLFGRRLGEMLGVLNGTWTPGGGSSGPTAMGFGAGGVEGKGWTFKSQSVEPGWLAGWQERMMEVLYEPMDPVLWQELDGLVWGQ